MKLSPPHALINTVFTIAAMAIPSAGCAIPMDDGIYDEAEAQEQAASVPTTTLGSTDPCANNPALCPSAPPRLILANAADKWPVQVCLRLESTGQWASPPLPDNPNEPMPQTNMLGVDLGQASLLRSIDGLTNTDVTPYVVRADKANYLGVHACDQIVCDPNAGSCSGIEHVRLPTIPKGTLAKGGTYVMAVTGCTNAAVCGSDFGQVSSRIVHLHTGANPGAHQMTAQLVNLSTRPGTVAGYVVRAKGVTALSESQSAYSVPAAPKTFAFPDLMNLLQAKVRVTWGGSKPTTHEQTLGEMVDMCPIPEGSNGLDLFDGRSVAFLVMGNARYGVASAADQNDATNKVRIVGVRTR